MDIDEFELIRYRYKPEKIKILFVEVVVGIHYYFRSEKEINNFKNCNMFCAEGFIAIK